MSDTTAVTPNIPRLVNLARWLTREERERRLGRPSHWDQGEWVDITGDDGAPSIDVAGKPGGEQPVMVTWSCGTAACAAGHIALEDGGLPVFVYGGESHRTPPPDATDDPRDWAEWLSSGLMFFDGRAEPIGEHAQKALGLTEDQAGWLFGGGNNWGEMIHHISRFTGMSERDLLERVGGTDMPADPDGYLDDPCVDGDCVCCEDDE